MKKLLISLVLMLAVFASLSATYTETTLLRDFLVYTDAGSDATPTDTFGTNIDGYVSATFKGNALSNRYCLAVATVLDTIANTGTSVDHLTPIVQVSGNGTTWATALTLEAYSSTAETIGSSWAIVIDLSDITAPYVRLGYLYHTSADAALGDATNLGAENGIKTVIYAKPK